MSDSVTHELLTLSQQLLDAIDQQDWETYCQLCQNSLTAFEPEAVGNLVSGMDFHEFYFQMEATGKKQQSHISSPHVRLLGDVAVVTYVRLTQRLDGNGRPATTAFEETRIWHRNNDEWKHVHFHRSPAGLIEL